MFYSYKIVPQGDIQIKMINLQKNGCKGHQIKGSNMQQHYIIK